MARLQDDPELLRAALAGYQHQHALLTAKMSEIQKELGGRSVAVSRIGGQPTRRTLSAAARKRIGAAQKKRWAEYNKTKSKTAVAVKPAKKKEGKKRKLSAEGRKRIVEATRKRWAAVRAAKAAAAGQ